MLRYTIRRLAQLVLVVFVLSILLFAWLRSLPGGPVSAMLGDRATPEARAQLEADLGMDQPLFVQYLRFLGRAATGDFGTSTGVQPGTPAMEVFLTRFPATLELSVLALLLAVAIGIPLGYLAARKRGSWLDNLSITWSLVGVAVPVFFLAFLLKFVFAVQLGVLPASGRQDAGLDATRVTGFYILDGLLTREWDAAWNSFVHLILPAIALSTIPFAVIFRITRAAVLDVMDEDYVRTARAKGLASMVIRRRHILHNAMLPVVTTIGLQTGALLAGAVLTERVFNIAGIGQAVALGFERKDFPVLQVVILASAMMYVLVNLLVDLSYALIDPRLRTR
ncbi:peptide/nickel transport system permease protein [Saccharopolyspora antimicrobica]|uniref:Peptide/nickel transport system permease protein n=2 Tax=Saccharopolyspora TaxID=1835 RepID=A0A1I5IR11_9PSEU|nr:MULTISPECIES: ABC transporter permease [Saccharopolyspora]RKT84123.1 peptide/nickel transport system permease protein [Saccharopolyspora antimicrobica]SEG83435.1 peptide/nickel transport system permease protein [Saccharopolyspora kobensis]SFE31117.1 peptide/nickel transport system permease protein [Saccharopolyspora kobensis]SFO62932.1 peptide/nickel transport system permease protein [Saccharopolyspora antimicrobica]